MPVLLGGPAAGRLLLRGVVVRQVHEPVVGIDVSSSEVPAAAEMRKGLASMTSGSGGA
jgi:hypothetical protein